MRPLGSRIRLRGVRRAARFAYMEPGPGEREARATLEAIPGLTWQPFQRVDLPAVAELYAQCEAFDGNPEHHSLVGLEEFWDSPRSRADKDTLIAVDSRDRVVATAWAGCNRVITDRRGVYLGGAVHPTRRGEGIGRAVLRWQMAHGIEWDRATRQNGFGPLVMRLYAPTDQTDVRDLAERYNLTVARYAFEMSRPLGEPVMSSQPEGVRIVDWDAGRSREVHRVVDIAFRDHWAHVDRTDEMWDEAVSGHAFRPEWSALAVEDSTGSVVGAALNCAHEQGWHVKGFSEGYTDELAVAATHRGRGIATALLQESMRRFAASGMDAAGLGVDAANPSGALRLYEGLGYEQTASTCVHQFTQESGS
jgi:mycothiol synthase